MPFKPILASISKQPKALRQCQWPQQAIVKVAAPHPDDFDAIAVTLKHFQQLGLEIQLYVVSGGSKGVEDSFISGADWEAKAKVREAEQLSSTRLFGLADQCVHFLRLTEADDGELSDDPSNQSILASALLTDARPNIWCLPFGEDSNSGHQRTYRMVKEIALKRTAATCALYNKDAKTLRFNTLLFTSFDHEEAEWKAALLKCHHSQQARNLNVRGYGFDHRVLSFNQETANELPTSAPYAETFQIEILS